MMVLIVVMNRDQDGECHQLTLASLLDPCTRITAIMVNVVMQNWKHTWWYKVNGAGLLVSWFLVRIVMFVYFFVHLYHHR